MPFADPEQKREYARKWYARPENRQRVIENVAKRKHSLYAGTCNNCGGPTVGSSKKDIPEWCGKPECRSAQRKAMDPAVFTNKKEKSDGGNDDAGGRT